MTHKIYQTVQGQVTYQDSLPGLKSRTVYPKSIYQAADKVPAERFGETY